MNNSIRTGFCKGDILAIAAVLFLAVVTGLLFLPRETDAPPVAQVYQDGQLLATLPLSRPETLEISGRYRNAVTVADNSVYFSASDCPGEDCVHSGAIRTSGRSLVCLPNGVEVRVVSGESDVDFVVG